MYIIWKNYAATILMFKLSSLFENSVMKLWKEVGQRPRNSCPLPSSVIFVVKIVKARLVLYYNLKSSLKWYILLKT